MEEYMAMALAMASEAAKAGETPVGCVITDRQGNVIASGRNRTEEKGDPTCHAELEAIREACKKKGDWRLEGCSLYVTMEPCPMCAGAILLSRIGRLCFGARDRNLGSCGSVINLFMENYGRSPEIVGGVMERECAGLLTDFFRDVREK